MKVALIWLCLGLLFGAPSAPAQASETFAHIATDLEKHGYQSGHAALDRMRHASDLPPAGAPLDVRLSYERALLKLALQAHQTEQVRTSLATLQRMDKQENCAPCRFYALLAQARLSLDDLSASAARPYIDQANALLGNTRGPIAEEMLYTMLGNNQARDGQLDVGIENTMKALKLAEARNDAAGAVALQGDLVRMNANLGDLNRATTLGKEAYARAETMDFRPKMAQISLDLGHVYSLSGDRANQRTAIERSLALSRDDPDLLGLQVLGLNNLSDLYLSEPGQERRVLDYARRAEAMARTHGLELRRAAPLTNIGLAQARLGQVDEGVAHIREAVLLSEHHEQKEYVVGITRELVGVLERAGRYREALTELRKADALELDLTRQQRESAVLDLQEKYAAEYQAQEIAQLSSQNALKQAELSAQSWRNRLWTALALMLAIGSVVLMRSIRDARKANRSLAVANASLAEQTTIDPLTGAANRRHVRNLLQDQLPAQQRRANSGETPQAGVGLLLLDLDFFKHVNDSHGHAAGDVVLVAVAQRLRKLLRQEDTVARWGGEEFVLVLPHTPASALPAVARNVLHGIGATPVSFGGSDIAVTVSLGAVSFPTYPGQDWEAALAVADLALYQAKSAGRNRAVCLTQVHPHADLQWLRVDLAQSEHAGEIELTVVHGPAAATQATSSASVHATSPA